MKAISDYTDVGELRQVMANAKRLNKPDVYWEAFERCCELQGGKYPDPLERDFYSTLAAYEELLAEKHGRRQSASRTRQKLRNKGFIACLEDWALDGKRTEGFETLVKNGHVELTGEYLVTKYPDRFTAKAVENATLVLAMLKVFDPENSTPNPST